MVAVRRILLIAALLAVVLGGYVFSAGSAAPHATRASGPNIPCSGGPFSC